MSKREAGTKSTPFPAVRPDVAVKPTRAKPFGVDNRELRSWFGVPEVGDHTMWATYDPPERDERRTEWRLTTVSELQCVRPALVHGVDCAEIEVAQWEPETGWRPGEWLMYGQLTDDECAWLATVRLFDGKRVLRTFLDEGFHADWGSLPRRLEDRGRYAVQPDGSLKLRRTGAARKPGAVGAGMFRVRIGERAWTCLRTLEHADEPSDTDLLMESFLTRDGRTLICRRYNAPQWARHEGSSFAKQAPWDERFPANQRLLINGVTYVHWYDCLSRTALGIKS